MGSRFRRAATLTGSASGGEHAPIAILGLGCVLPGGCDGPAALWQALESGGDLVGPLPEDRWSAAAHYNPDPAIPGKTVTRWGGFLQGIREFDAAFFGISPREAALVDPQQRLLLQVTWEALEDAGIPPDSLEGSATGVYVGISNSDYHAIQKLGPTGIDVHTGTGGALSIAANRISHRFDLRGPSIAIDTACSSALVALDAACRALWSGECTLALAGGVNVMLTPEVTISFSRASMLSPDGRCMAFDARANGYVRGEGAGMVVLKPLAAALADGDRIQAIIRATAVNQDGHTSTITVPSQPAQEAMLREACRRAAVDPAIVGYVEAHGTGTAVGDPIEAGAIGAVFGRARSDGTRCLMGSIKTNIGHLESAAGVAGVIKAVLCLRHGAIPPNLHFVTPNPDIPFDELGIAVPTRLQPWPDRGGRRVAAVNSFGFGGTNACALLEAWPDNEAKAGAAPRRLVVPLSAASPTALATQAGRIGQHLEQSKAPLAAVAATLAHRRAHLDHRLAVVAGSRPELARKLLAFSRGERVAGCVAGRASTAGKLAFVFTGQGAQWWAMGRGLLAGDAVFRAAVEACDRLFQRLSGWSLTAELMADESSTRMGETAVAQPAMFALQVALAERWRAWGVVPDAVVGHSIGEIAAAYVSGALSLEDAVAVVYHRSRLQERSRGAGAMAAIGVPSARAEEMLAGSAGRLEVAAINGPSLVTVAGDTAELDRLLAQLDAEGSTIFRRWLEVDLAFHSRQMDPHQAELTACLGGLRPGHARVPMISTVTADAVADGELDAAYWWRNMRQPVLFQPAIDRLSDDGHAAFLEIGPHAALAVPVTACLEQRGRAGYVVASLRRGQDDRDTMLEALGELHVRGHAIAWEGVISRRRGFVGLPGNPWEKQSFWTESEEARAIRHDVPSHPLLGHRLRVAEPVWQVEIGRRLQPFLADHGVDGAVVFPAAAYLEMLLAAARELFGEGPWEAEKIVFHEALMLGEDESVLMQTICEPERSRVSILSRLRDRETGWTLRTTAQIRARPMQPPSADGWAALTLAPERIGADRLYRDLASEGHQFGPAFRGIELLWRADGMALGRIATPAALAGGTAGHLMHPAILDSCLQVIRGFRGFPELEEVGVVLPVGLRRLRCFRAVDGPIYSQARQVDHEAARVVADIVVFDEGGNIVASLDGFECRRWPRAMPSEAAPPELYRELWRPRAEAAEALPTADRPAATWLIFADRRGIGDGLAAALEARGDSCLVVRAGARSRRIDKRRFELRVDAGAPLDRLLATARRARPPLAGIVHLWSLDGVGRDPGDAQQSGSLHLLALAQRLVADAADGAPRLWACGAGAWQPDGSAPRDEGGLVTATLSGLCRALRTEHPQLRCTLLDLPLDKAVAGDLAAELLADGEDAEILLRPAGRHVGVVQRVAAEDLPPAVVRRGAGATALPFALTLPGPGRIDAMTLREIAVPAPAPGEVVIEVRAAGLNFRDVMAASGLLPAGAEEGDAWRLLGLECAGVVAGVGDGVSRLRPGDEVIALARGCFASHLVVPEGLVFAKPKGLGFVDAACLPTAFLTAWHALVTQGRMTAGERVLITAAAGGVGQAAIQIATALGAEIYAAAGSVEKRDHLRRLGIRHVFDSRTLDFADEVMAASDGAGVDLILNSQPGAFIEKGLSVLAPFGRFLEIGKRDIYLDTPVGLHALRNNASIMAVDLGRLPQQRPALLRDAMTAIFAGLESGTLRPLPVETFPVSRAADAFRRLSQARHIGKVALVMDEPDAAVALSEDRPLTLRPDGTYLVTGGLGGFGLATARWLADRGARRLLLLGRSAASAEALEAVAALGGRGVEVRIEQADVTDLPRLEALIQSIDPATPLRGLVHAAMVLDDGFVRQLDADRFATVLAPKMQGAWNLHRATAGCPLDFFVLYSSISALTGAAGQANYAAGNRYLDALAEHRRRCGLPALSIAWGAIADAGYLTRREDVARYLGSAGIEPMAAAEALAMLGRLLNQDVAAVAYARVDWAKLAALNPAVTATSRFAEVTAAIGTARAGVGRIAAELAAAPPAARPAILTSYLQDKVGGVLRIDPAAVEPTRPLAELGLDSLTSFELKGKVERELGVSLPIARFLQRPSVATLVAAFIERLDSAGQDGGGAEGFGGGADDGTLSHGQEALWFLHRLAPASPAYNLVYCVQIQPAPDRRALQDAFRGVLARHRVLRGAFLDDQGVPVQRLLDPESFSVEEHDARALDDGELRRVLSRCGNEPFVTAGPLIQLHVFRRRDGDALLLKIHHLVVDAWSLSLVLSDLFALYFAARDGVLAKLPPLGRVYADYVRWSRALVARPEGQAQLAYWRRQLAAAPPLLELPTDRPRPAAPSGEGDAVGFAIGAATTQKLKALAAAEGVTLFAVLLAAYQVLLQKLSGQRDLLVGVPVSGRSSAAFDQVVGYFVNPVVIRGQLDDAAEFTALLRRTDATVRAALEHQDYPFPLLVQALQADRDAGRSPLFQVAFAMERSARVDDQGFAVTLLNVAGPKLSLRGHAIETVGLDRNRAQFDLGFTVEEFDDRLYGIVDYRSDLFEPATIERFATWYDDLLALVAERPSLALGEIALGTVPAPASAWRGDEFPDVVAAIVAAARATPESAAVSDADGTLSYAELVGRAAALAAALTQSEAGPGSLVAIAVSRSAALAVALLGTLMAGAAFVPLDLAHPPARLAAILDDAAPVAIVTESAMLHRLPPRSPAPVLLDALEPARDAAAASVAADGGELAYLIYTSGSTGAPAGVRVPRRALANFIGAMARLALLRPDDRLLAVTTPSFDIALLELLLPLAVGATTVVADEATCRDGRGLARRLESDAIDVMQATPATWAMLVDAGWTGAPGFTALCGGEALPADLAAALLERADAVWNLYGPTETTIWSTAARLVTADERPIGRPIANTLCRVLDEQSRPVPLGAVGELIIGGAGLADGYHRRPDATAARFVTIDGEPFFRTGDLVRQSEDGAFAFIGRRDRQLKLRGFRIEPGEIEAALRLHPDVAAAAVTMIGDDLRRRRLVALVVPRAGGQVDAAALRSWLGERLPPHAVPADCRMVASLPLTANGKLDRGTLALLAAGEGIAPQSPREPRSRDEISLAQLATELLGPEPIGVDDDLYERGATSLLMVRLVARAGEALGIDLAVTDLAGNATIARLARRVAAIRERSAGDEPLALPVSLAGPLDWRPLALRRAADEIGPVEAVALAYLPDDLAGRGGTTRRQIAAELFEGRPSWHSVEDTPLGRIGLVVVPVFGADLFAPGDAASAELARGIELAGTLGARCVSLTGLIPAATDFGRALKHRDGGPALTTGHATTAAAMVLSIATMLEQADRRLEDEAAAFVGLGSIGQATLRLMLDQAGHPAMLTLCDLPAKRPMLEALAEELRRDLGYHGRVVIATAAGRAPDAAYSATLLVGATNVPDVVDVARLAPGTLVVDDFFPPCLSVPAAAARLRTRGDILFTAGGFVRAPGRITRAIALPPAAARFAGHAGLRRALGKRVPDEITGCILSALLSVVRPDLPAQLGPVGLEACRAHLHALRALGFGAASLGTDAIAPTQVEIAAFRQRFGALDAA